MNMAKKVSFYRKAGVWGAGKKFKMGTLKMRLLHGVPSLRVKTIPLRRVLLISKTWSAMAERQWTPLQNHFTFTKTRITPVPFLSKSANALPIMAPNIRSRSVPFIACPTILEETNRSPL